MTAHRAAMTAAACVMPGCGQPVDEWGLCNADLFALIGQCLGKKRLPRHTPRGLVMAPGLVKYQCPICGHWHIGAKLPDQLERSVRTDHILSILRRAGMGGFITQLAGHLEGVDRSQWKAQHAARVATERVEAARRGPIGEQR